jgi:hypothetical protein
MKTTLQNGTKLAVFSLAVHRKFFRIQQGLKVFINWRMSEAQMHMAEKQFSDWVTSGIAKEIRERLDQSARMFTIGSAK